MKVAPETNLLWGVFVERHALSKIFWTWTCLALATPALGDTLTFKGVIDLNKDIEPSDRVFITVNVTESLPATGEVKNESHLVVEPETQKQTAVCEYHYTFAPPQVTVTLNLENGIEIGKANSETTIKGTVYSDSPASNDISQCNPPAAGKFPISGPLDITMGALKTFQLPSGVMLSLEPPKETFTNEAIINLLNGDVRLPTLTGLKLTSIDKLKWATFGTGAPSKTGIVSLKPE